MKTAPLIKLHRDETSEIAGDCEIWVNPAHVVSIEPQKVPNSEPCASIEMTTFHFTTMESYAWVVEQLTGYSADEAFGMKNCCKANEQL
jgi:hypothetical protein